MLGVYIPNPNLTVGWEVEPLFIDDGAWYITHKYGGYDTLTFEIETKHKMYKYIAEEVKIHAEKNIFVVKTIDSHSSFATVQCDLDFEDWQQKIYPVYRRTYVNIRKVLDEIKPSNWRYTIDNSLASKVTTVEASSGEAFKSATPYEILSGVADAFGCVFEFDMINKKLSAIDPTLRTPTGEFYTDELNLKSIGYTGTSDGFATRLYAYGKEINGEKLTFASINDGKEYIDNNTYSDKIICVGWTDERYTVKENLLADAKERLKQLAVPSRSYTCDIKYLSDAVEMYDIVTLIDREKEMRINHQIVEYKEYKRRDKSSITLSKLQPTINSIVTSSSSQVRSDLIQQTAEMQELMKASVDYAMQQITGANGGNVQIIYNTQGKPYQILWLIDSDELQNVNKLFKFDATGLSFSSTGYSGAYTTLIDADGNFDIKLLKDNDGNSWNMATGKAVWNGSTTIGGKTITQWLAGLDIPDQQELTKEQLLTLLLGSNTTLYTGEFIVGDKKIITNSGMIQKVENYNDGGETT